ncbi:hypothetical protein DWB61_13155 [Ancylomarina euxinus]|uniref:DUF2946 domain-containing protein n=1 Tax=Ancylomarina euxinus TaxID=2283627 RepID=A0A425XYZ2_9BACT|nr:hypothetical protein [Ancylomarina euxinus]MCZ4695649.1 hypothetical protein [Ancylomarina euxinus]MUP16047.1 hypothetical protein [Ancylomarina euxinus]RRG20291.1 hypothetical protein DWB61_13155 [Ancylomarina euxinus]
MEFFRKIKIAVLIALIPTMLALTGNAIFNLHIHKQANGSLYSHAHPFNTHNSNNGSSHSHSCNDCVSIHNLTSLIFVAITALILSMVFEKQLRRVQFESLQTRFGYKASLLNNRPPPFLA